MRAPLAAFLLATVLVAPAVAQTPGKADTKLVTAGSYKVDPAHTQVVWTVDHMGVSPLSGAFAASEGMLEIDPAKPAAAKVSVTFDTSNMVVTAPAFAKHLSSPDFFEVTKFPTATFVSTSVVASGTSAKISGNLTIKGITKPVVLDAKFFGAATNPMSKALNIGFSGTATIKRSEFGLGMAVPIVSDEVKIIIHAAFVKA
ncbi:YceI family protein [Sphingomonas naphthae]|uniref:YceI family protein n=1 Tax=Sphingomonas naphthae TaxID=1813468 RepID=A0ABY7TIB7_9SPHN|nr:YceI family protein [Sphingomonas naphthae]WCT72920.1 YceI family protein [Sphingomonas naphthae]